MILGQGSYGQVIVREGLAVKKFNKLSHLIQEYAALRYLEDCKYVVHGDHIDCVNLELHMQLYSCSLRNWWTNFTKKRLKDNERLSNSFLKKEYKQDILTIIHDILRGLVELHDRGLAHGDLKPGNILIQKRPLKAVLGDCGFVSIAKYSKLERCAEAYRDPEIQHDLQHDMFSLGICLLELLGDIKINRQANYKELKPIIKEKIEDKRYQEIILNLVHSDRSRRPTARQLLHILFQETPEQWTRPPTIISGESSISAIGSTLSVDQRHEIKSLMKQVAYKFEINRAKRGYGAVLAYITHNNIKQKDYSFYAYVTLLILSALFSNGTFDKTKLLKLLHDSYSLDDIYKAIVVMLEDNIFIKVLLAPSANH